MYLNILGDLKNKANYRYNNFEIKEASDSLIKNINDEAYILKPIWTWWDKKYVALFVDLNDSTELSNERYKSVMAKIYDYFTQSIIDCLSVDWYADYIDIKWDWVFAIFEWEKAKERAFVSGVIFKTFFEKYVVPKFKKSNDIELTCKMWIYEDKILVRKLWNKKFKNEVWAWKLINVISKLVSYPKNNCWYTDKSYFVLDDNIYNYFFKNYEDYIIKSCWCPNWEKEKIWKEFFIANDKKLELWNNIDNIYIMTNNWCDIHWQDYINNILDK